MYGLTTRHLTGILGVVFLLCGMTPFARADIVLIPLDGSSDAKPENYGYKVAAWRIGDLAVIRLDLSTDAEKAFLGGTLTLSKASREIVNAPLWLSEKKKDGAAIVLKVDTNAIDGGELEFSSGDIGGMGLGRASGFRLDIARLLKKAASPEQVQPAARLKAVVTPAVTKVHPNEPFQVAFRVENPTAEKQTIRVMSCSWNDNWQSDNKAVSIGAWPCGANADIPVEIAPGKAYEFKGHSEMVVAANTPPGKLAFRMGFSSIQPKSDLPEVFWSDPIELQVVAVAPEQAKPADRLKAVVTPSVTKVHPNEPFKVAFGLENPTDKTQTIRVMACSWYNNWKSDDPAVSIVGWACKDDGAVQPGIEPGKIYKFDREAELNVAPNTPPGKLSFRLGFTGEIWPKPGVDMQTYWSEPITVEVLAAEGAPGKAAQPTKVGEQSRDRDPRQFPNKEAQPLKAIAKPTATKVRAGESVEVELSVQNKTTEKQTIRIWSCSWYENWQSDNAAVSIADAWPCSDNGPMSVEIAPGKAHKFVRGQEKNAHLNVDAKAPPGKITFRLGFSNCADAIKDLPEVFWSEPIELEVVAGEVERANPPPAHPDQETPDMRKGALFENPKALEATPDELRKTYAAFVTAIQNGAVPTEFLLPSAVSVSTEPRPEKTAEYGQDINVPFLKKGFSSAVQLVREDADDSYLIRTGTTAIWFVETKSGKWKIYRYLDHPIE